MFVLAIIRDFVSGTTVCHTPFELMLRPGTHDWEYCCTPLSATTRVVNVTFNH